MNYTILPGDCLQVLRMFPDCYFDSIVTDPPYGLSFMGRKWDYDVPSVDVWVECLRVLKPGGHLLAFAGTRTQHRMAVRIEDAGFEIRDMIAWVYSTGFPKSHNGEWGGTALKPALEPITMARKPLAGTVEANWREHGTGALNIDGCRVEPTGESRERVGEASQDRRYAKNGVTDFAATPGVRGGDPAGRWPANLIHNGSDEVVGLFPMQTSGSAARFFYCAKASKADRDEGLDHLPETEAADFDQRPSGDFAARMNRIRPPVLKRNHHPTVKPTELMRYLCRLVTPPGGVVLDPFMGSGSTGKAAVLEGFRFVGVEREAEYVEIARARIAGATNA